MRRGRSTLIFPFRKRVHGRMAAGLEGQREQGGQNCGEHAATVQARDGWPELRQSSKVEGETKHGDVKDEVVAALADSLSGGCQERAECG